MGIISKALQAYKDLYSLIRSTNSMYEELNTFRGLVKEEIDRCTERMKIIESHSKKFDELTVAYQESNNQTISLIKDELVYFNKAAKSNNVLNRIDTIETELRLLSNATSSDIERLHNLTKALESDLGKVLAWNKDTDKKIAALIETHHNKTMLGGVLKP